jgi:tetratricopeptide (TPR) repeat protein
MRKLATLLIVVVTATTVDAKPNAKDKAAAHMAKAAKAHKAGKFEVALTELQAAYAIQPQPKLLFAIGQVYAKLDDCEAAIEHYEKFEAATKDKSKQAVVKQAIDACKKKLADKPEKQDQPDKGDAVFRAKKPPADELPTADPKPDPEPEPNVDISQGVQPEPSKPVEPSREIKAFDDPPPPPKPGPSVAVVTTTTSSPTRKPWYRDALGDALVITGVGATIGSFFTYRAAQNELDAAENDSSSLAEYDDHRSNAERNRLYTIVLAGGGLAFVTAGVLRYSLRGNGRETRGVAIVPSSDGGLITWSGGF